MSDKQASVEVNVKGAERAAAQARSALRPWGEQAEWIKGKFKALRGEIQGAVGNVVQDLGRVVTVGSSISFSGAVSSVQTFEKASSAVAVAVRRDWESVKTELNELAVKVGATPEQVANYVGNVGRATYDFKQPMKDLQAYNKFAKETGRDLASTSGLSVAFKNMGVEDADKALKNLRATADQFKTVGGVAALSDQVVGLSSAFQKASNDASQLTALTAMLGRGLTPQRAEAVQQSIVGTITGRAREYEAHFHNVGLLKRGEHILDPLTGKVDVVKAATLLQKDLSKFGRGKGGRIAGGQFGDLQAGALFMDMPLAKLRALGGKDTDAQERYAATPGGMADTDEAEKEKNLGGWVGHGSFLGGLRERFRKFSSGNPLGGFAVEQGISATLGGIGTYLGMTKGAPLLKGAGGLVTAAKGVGLLGAGIGGAGAAGIGASLLGLGTMTAPVNKARYQIQGEMEEQFENTRRGRARALIHAAERSGGTLEGFAREAGKPLLAAAERDPALKQLAQQIAAGESQLTGLSKSIGQAVKDALKGSPLKIVVIDATTEGIGTYQPGSDM